MSDLSVTIFEPLQKELRVDADGKGYVSRRGLARLCGASRQTWGRGSIFTREIDEHLARQGFDLMQLVSFDGVCIEAAVQVIQIYAYKGNKTAIESFNAIYPKNPISTKRKIVKSSCTQSCVYIVQCTKTGVIKIGVSNNPLLRIKAIQTSYPYPLSLVRTIDSPHPLKTEKGLHVALADFKLNGEWFDGFCLQMIGAA